MTGPWLHDGSAKTLQAAIEAHANPIDGEGIALLIDYLGALTDQGFLSDPRFAYPDDACRR